MSNNIRRGDVPSDLGFLADFMGDAERRLAELESPSGTQYANTVAGLQASVEELEKRRVYLAEQNGPDGAFHAGDTTPPLAPVTFTLTERRRVRVEASSVVNVRTVSTTGYSQAAANVIWHANGERMTISELPIWQQVGPDTFLDSRTQHTFVDYAVLEPGEHTVATLVEVTVTTGEGTEVRVYTTRTGVQILDRVEPAG